MPDEIEKLRYLSADDDLETWSRILAEATEILDAERIPYLTIGSIATIAMGYEEVCSDIDLLVTRPDAKRALAAFARHGYETQRPEPDWLFKATKDQVLVDIIFRVGDGNEITADEEMFRRGRYHEVNGTRVRVISAEDFLVMQAVSNKSEAPDYWHKGVNAASAEGLDWDYVVERSGVGPERVLSLLIYALSEGAEIPKRTLDELYRRLEV